MAIGLIAAGQRITAALLNSIAPLCVIKPADQSVTNSVVLVNDNALAVPVVAGATYLFDCYLDFEGGTTGSSDLQWQWQVPTGATLRYASGHVNTGAFVFTSYTGASNVTASTNGAGTILAVTMKGSLTMSSTGGNLQLKWAQNTANATATIVHAQSYLALWRIS